MASWHETDLVLARLAELHSAGEPCALATVIRVEGSAYRRPGAKLLVEANGNTTGNVSGGCLEQDVVEVALQVIRSGKSQRRRYCSAGDDVSAWDLGVGCEGEVEVFIEPVRDGWDTVRAQLALEIPFVITTELGSEGTSHTVTVLDADRSDAPASSGLRRNPAGQECFCDLLVPGPHLIIVGAGNDAQPLAQLALATGLRVTVVDHRPGLLLQSRFPGNVTLLERWPAENSFDGIADPTALAVIMTHNFADDTKYLRALLHTPVRYLGVLGPRQRTERILSLIDVVEDDRVHGPIGLDIGGEGATQVAVAILAQLLAVSNGRSAEALRDRTAPIHALGSR